MSQAQQARAALEEKQKKAQESAEESRDGEMTARQRAMQNLAKTGAVSKREAQGLKGESQMSTAMKSFGGEIGKPQPKVIPNWKQSAAQRAAYEEKKAMRAGGESQMASAMKAFGGQMAKGASGLEGRTTSFVPTKATSVGPKYGSGAGGGVSSANSTPRTFVPTSSSSTPRTMSFVPTTGTAAKPAASGGVVKSASAMPTSGVGAAEAEEGVENDLKLLTAGIKRLGVANGDGSYTAMFGKIVDDEELEQQLESLVGTLKAGRRRGVLEWQGQLLLKGKDNEAPIKLVAPKGEEPVAEEPKADEPTAEEPAAEEPAAEEPVAEEPVAEEPKAEEPVAEESVVEAPVSEEPVTEEPVVEAPAVEEPVAEEPVAEEPVALEEPKAEAPAAEAPKQVEVS